MLLKDSYQGQHLNSYSFSCQKKRKWIFLVFGWVTQGSLDGKTFGSTPMQLHLCRCEHVRRELEGLMCMQVWGAYKWCACVKSVLSVILCSLPFLKKLDRVYCSSQLMAAQLAHQLPESLLSLPHFNVGGLELQMCTPKPIFYGLWGSKLKASCSCVK